MLHCASTIVDEIVPDVTGRETPSVAGVINPGSDGFQKLFFGQEEIAVPVHGRCELNLGKTRQVCSSTTQVLF